LSGQVRRRTVVGILLDRRRSICGRAALTHLRRARLLRPYGTASFRGDSQVRQHAAECCGEVVQFGLQMGLADAQELEPPELSYISGKARGVRQHGRIA
jgi:hypothetical protein